MMDLESPIKIEIPNQNARNKTPETWSSARELVIIIITNTYKKSIDTAVNSDLEPGASFLQAIIIVHF